MGDSCYINRKDRQSSSQIISCVNNVGSGELLQTILNLFLKYFMLLPKEKPANSVQSKMVQTKTGFLAEIAIPLKDFELEKAKWIDKFGFTLVFSDTDSAEKPAQDTLLATSLLEWGNAYTFGEIWLDLEYFKDFHFYLLDSVWDDRRFYY